MVNGGKTDFDEFLQVIQVEGAHVPMESAPVCMPVCVLVCDIKKCFEYTYILICLSYLSSLHTFPHAYLYMKQSYANLYI
jgi:hypothetical protein